MEPPVIQRFGTLLVLRDDMIPGGTKRRVIDYLLRGATEFVYASPAYGYAQVALALACREAGYKATIFTAKRGTPHDRTLEAMRAEANVVMIPYGYLSNVQSKAKRYAEERGARLLPFGFDTPEFGERLTALAKSLPICPSEVWSVAGSGTLTRALQAAWPSARFYAIRVGANADTGVAHAYQATEPFERNARRPPPFPSCSNFDAKAWCYVEEYANPGALFWNVAA